MPPLSMLPVVAAQEIASRSQQSIVNAMRTRLPLSQPISKLSEHPRGSGDAASGAELTFSTLVRGAKIRRNVGRLRVPSV
jgi:hypothetical protein